MKELLAELRNLGISVFRQIFRIVEHKIIALHKILKCYFFVYVSGMCIRVKKLMYSTSVVSALDLFSSFAHS